MSRIYGRTFLAALLCSAGFMLAGCGGESAPTPNATTTTQTHEETPVQPPETTTTTHKPSTYPGELVTMR